MNKGKMPLVSVITPAYNAESFIRETIDSVLAQSVSDWELIVIDDGSTDDTQIIVAEYEKADDRIHLIINENNMGVARTRNRGLDMFRGQYVAFLDSDDYWEPQMLEKMLARAQETGADIIYCSYALVDESGRKVCNDFIVPPKTTFKESIVRSVITCSTVLITAELARNNRFPTDMYHEDIAMWFQILRDGGTACGVTEILASYRQRANSRSAGKLVSACRRYRHVVSDPKGWWDSMRCYRGSGILSSKSKLKICGKTCKCLSKMADIQKTSEYVGSRNHCDNGALWILWDLEI